MFGLPFVGIPVFLIIWTHGPMANLHEPSAWKGASEIWGYLKSQPNGKQGGSPRFQKSCHIVQFGSMPEFPECNWVGPHTQTKTNLEKCLSLGVQYLTSLWYWVASFYVVSLREYFVHLAVWLFMLVTSELSDSVRADFLPCHVRVLDRVNSNIRFVNYMNNTYLWYTVHIDSDKCITSTYSSILYPTLWRYLYKYHPVVFFCWTLSLKHFPLAKLRPLRHLDAGSRRRFLGFKRGGWGMSTWPGWCFFCKCLRMRFFFFLGGGLEKKTQAWGEGLFCCPSFFYFCGGEVKWSRILIAMIRFVFCHLYQVYGGVWTSLF